MHYASEGAKNYAAEGDSGRDAVARFSLSVPEVFHPVCASLSAAIFTYTSAKRRGKEIHPLSLRAPAARFGRRGVSAVERAIQGADRKSQGAARRWFFRRRAENL